MDGKELKSQLQLFEGRKVRTVWDEEAQEWFFSVVDVVAVLTDSADPKQYIKKMRARDPELNARWGTICTPTRIMASDGKCYNTQAADLQGMFRIIQSIPSPKAEPFKQWMAQVAVQRIDQMLDPELSIDQAVAEGAEELEIHIENALVKRALGYSYREVTRERKLVVNPETGENEYKLVVTKSVTKHVVPDVGAQQYYLEHRAPKRWERVPTAYIDNVQVNADIQSIADLLNNPQPERQIGDEELSE